MMDAVNIRPSVLAGAWYPADAEDLQTLLTVYLDNVPDMEFDRKPFGCVLPHAGYVYSGQTAAHGIKALSGFQYSHIALVSPLHRWRQGRFFVPRAEYYETPLGRIPVDHDAIEKLAQKISLEFLEDDEEHSIEIQLPFFQMTQKDFKILPLMVSSNRVEDVLLLSQALSGLEAYSDGAWIASSDLNHEQGYSLVKDKDHDVLDMLVRSSYDELSGRLPDDRYTVCGKVPILTVLKLAEGCGRGDRVLLNHVNSGEVTGTSSENQYTVGYAAVLFK